MDPLGRLIPIHLAWRNREAVTGAAVTVLNGDRVPAEHDRNSVEWIAVPGRGFTGHQALPTDECGPAMV
jgi:hypothetical protein